MLFDRKPMGSLPNKKDEVGSRDTKKLRIPTEKLIIELDDIGNTVSFSIPIAIKKSIDKGVIKKGDTIMVAGFGVGLSWGGSILEIGD